MSDFIVDEIGDVAEAEARYKDAVAFQAINASRNAATMKLQRRGLYVSVSLNFLLGLGIISILPLKTYVPITGYQNEAGIYETTTDYSDLPLTQQAAGIESTLSMYVVYRERYVSSEADRDYDIVSKLSADPVRKEYQTYANPKLNPDSPASQAGSGGFVRINVIKGADWISHADDWSTGQYKIRFCRTLAKQGMPAVKQLMEQQIVFEKTADLVPPDQRTTFNPASIAVTSYPPSREEGAPGAVDPCAQL